MALTIRVEKKEDGSCIICPKGSIDSDTHMLLEKEFKTASGHSPRGIILDMAAVDYISSIGFGVIIRAKQALEKNGVTLAITELQPNVKRVFEAVKVIPESLFATLEQADEYLDQYIAFIHKGKGESGK